MPRTMLGMNRLIQSLRGFDRLFLLSLVSSLHLVRGSSPAFLPMPRYPAWLSLSIRTGCATREMKGRARWRANMCHKLDSETRKRIGSWCLLQLFHDREMAPKLLTTGSVSVLPHEGATLRHFYQSVEQRITELNMPEASKNLGTRVLGGFLSSKVLMVGGMGPGNRCMLCGREVVHRFSSAAIETSFLEMFERVRDVCRDAGTSAEVSQHDLHHAHMFWSVEHKLLGLLFHLREYPKFDQERFPYQLGFCQEARWSWQASCQ